MGIEEIIGREVMVSIAFDGYDADITGVLKDMTYENGELYIETETSEHRVKGTLHYNSISDDFQYMLKNNMGYVMIGIV